MARSYKSVWTWNKPNGGRFANINRPIAGATHDKALPVGKHPLQLYSLATPNGVKVTVMLEELLALGHAGAEYDAWLIRIGEGDQFGSGFVEVNPNSKIPALLDRSGPQPVRVFESGAILLLPGREVRRLPADRPGASAPSACPGCSGRWAARPTWAAASATSTPTRRQDRVRDRPLRDGDQAPARRARPPPGREPTSPATTTPSPTSRSGPGTARWPKGQLYGAGEFLQVQDYTHVQRWADRPSRARPAVQRGRMVNRTSGDPPSQLHERHDASDFDITGTKLRRPWMTP
jgi:GSH-dependent disulfide-bond oxidoreductase